ncbi:MAG: PspC domain-containing protein [Candidatus Aminicenantes bacterium]|nr:PspC domain-containing protein [Candidatus Aminicenantes bacterium]
MSKKLYRSLNKKIIGGVCGGLADYFDLDVSLVRLIFVAIALVTALLPMLIFYVIAWIIIPVEEAKKE